VLAFVSLVLLILAFVVHRKIDKARDYLQTLQGQVSTAHRERQGYEAMLHSPESEKIFMQANDLSQIVDAKALSWTLVMQELEGVLPNGVQVSAIEPARTKDGSITLRLRVQGPRDKSLDLVRHLEVSQRFLFPRIVDEAPVINGGSNQNSTPPSASSVTQFDLLAGYNTSTSDYTSDLPPGNESADTASNHAALQGHNEASPDHAGRDTGKSKVPLPGAPGGGK
jgi:type IV pilus assembly protein PilN